MADTQHIIDGQVIPYSGGRKHSDTASWRDATDLEMEQQLLISELESEVANLRVAAELIAERSNARLEEMIQLIDKAEPGSYDHGLINGLRLALNVINDRQDGFLEAKHLQKEAV